MGTVFEGHPDGAGSRIGIVVSRFNEQVTRQLLEGARQCLQEHGVGEQDVEVAWVPGAFEIPQTARILRDRNRYQAIICLGAVIRGGTPHFEYVAGECARGIRALALESSIPVLFGVLTTDNLEQALERAGGRDPENNKGREAALAALEMINLFKHLQAS